MNVKKTAAVAAGVLAGIAVWAPIASASEPDNGGKTSDGGGRTTEGGDRTTDTGGRTTEGGNRTTDSGSDGRDRSSDTTCNFNSINTVPTTFGNSNGNPVFSAPINGGNIGNHASCAP